MNLSKKLVFSSFLLSFVLQPLAVVFAQEAVLNTTDISRMIIDDTAMFSRSSVTSRSTSSRDASTTTSVITPDTKTPDVSTSVIAPEITSSQTSETPVDRTERPSREKSSRTVDSRTVDPASATIAPVSLNALATSGTYIPPIDNTNNSKNKIIPEIDKLTGALTYNYKLNIPAGRNGMTPDVTLSYNSQKTDNSSVVGQGFELSIPSIKRINRYAVDQMYVPAKEIFTSSIDGELVLVDANLHTYRPKVDNGDFRIYTYINNTWSFTNKDGSVYALGTTAQARQDDPADSTRVYSWMLETITDTNNNNIKYNYFKETGQIYPDSINYGIFNIVFTRESKTSIISSSATGFIVTTNKRISEVRADINNSWSNKYSLTYKNADNGQDALINTITESRKDETSGVITTLPATTFDYTVSTPGWSSSPITIPTPSNTTKFSDINGDGLTDYSTLIIGSNPSQLFLNNGAGYTQNTSYQFPSSPLDTLDINGDGLADIIATNASGSNGWSSVYLNNGLNTWTLSRTFVPTLSVAGYLSDINSDGLIDYSFFGIGSNPSQLFINTGTEFIQNTSWQFPSSSTNILDINNDGLSDISAPAYGQNMGFLNNGINTFILDTHIVVPTVGGTNTKFTDINGDGLIDAVIINQFGVQLFLNNGLGYIQNNSYQFPVGTTDLMDVNGDGLADVIGPVATGGYSTVYLNNTKTKVNLLKIITNPSGATTAVEYKPSTQYKDTNSKLLNDHLPYIINTVSKITITDPVNNISSRSEYIYSGGEQFFVNIYDKQFPGFEKMTESVYDNTSNTLQKKIITYFHQGDVDSLSPIKNASQSALGESADTRGKIGKVFRTEVYDGSNTLYQTDITKWDSVNITTNSSFVFPIQTLSRINGKDVATSYVYNTNNGDLINQTNLGEVYGNNDGTYTDTGTDKYVTNYTYAISVDGKIHLSSSAITTNQNGTKEKETQYYYDALALGAVTKGNNTKVSNLISGTTYINNQKTYNAYGLVTSSIDPRNNVTNYSYDSYNLYPITITNPLSQNTSYIYNYSAGKPKQITDINGKVYRYTYDGLGRILTENIPDLSTSSGQVLKTSYIYTDTPNAVSVKKSDYLDSTNSIDTYQYFDSLGRIIQTRNESETGFNVSDTVYNAIGLVLKTSLPYTGSGTAKTSATSDTTLYTTNTYDTLNRPLTNTNALGTTSFTYNGWKTTVTDPNSKTKSYYKDAYDNLIKVDEINSGSTYTTNYTYNFNKNLLNITDALGNIRNFTYDNLGRRLTAQDLHAPSDTTYGIYNYVYDNAGNITQTTNPNGNITNYTYDSLNRNTSEDYLNSVGIEVGNVYDYCTNGKSKLCNTLMTSGANTNYTYDNLGNVATEAKTINSNTYNTAYTYDRLGNNITLTTPDLAVTQYTFNTAGMLEKIDRHENGVAIFMPVVTNFDYSPLNQITTQADANGVTTTNTYDINKMYRLTNKKTINATAVKLQDLSYTYDNVGNITKLIDASATVSAKTATYTYDDLYRLLSATIASVASGQTAYTQNYTYDALGNILTTTNAGDISTYSYAGNLGTNYANPHAVTSISFTSGRLTPVIINFTYDNAGNVLTEGTKSYSWDYNSRLNSVTIIPPPSVTTRTTPTSRGGSTPSVANPRVEANPTNTQTYTYDQAGQRVSVSASIASADGSTKTIYPNKFYNINNATAPKKTKSIFAGDNLIQNIETIGTTITPYYTHNDHLNSINVTTNQTGTQVQLLDYFPYGNIRIDQSANGTSSSQRKYIGQVFDASTGLNYLNARYYSSARGQFISEDPVFWNPEGHGKEIFKTFLSDPQTQNSYSYARNNPVTLSDPDGKFAVALALPALAIPGVGVVVAIGGIAVVGGYAIYEGSKVLVNVLKRADWGQHYIPGPEKTVAIEQSGLNQNPMGFEEWNPKNLDNKPKWVKNAVIGGSIIAAGAGIYKEFKDKVVEIKKDLSKLKDSHNQDKNKQQNIKKKDKK